MPKIYTQKQLMGKYQKLTPEKKVKILEKMVGIENTNTRFMTQCFLFYNMNYRVNRISLDDEVRTFIYSPKLLKPITHIETIK